MNKIVPEFDEWSCPLTGEKVKVLSVKIDTNNGEYSKSPPHCQQSECPWFNTSECPLDD